MNRPQQTSELIDEYQADSPPLIAVAWFAIKVSVILVGAIGIVVALMLRALRS